MSTIVIAIIALGGIGSVVGIYFIIRAFTNVGKYKSLYQQAIDQLVENQRRHNNEIDHTMARIKVLEEQNETIDKLKDGTLSLDDFNSICSGVLPKKDG